MRKKRCKCCHELYEPDPRTYRQQKTCKKERCRKQRKKKAVKAWKLKNPFSIKNNPIKQKRWRQRHPNYWKEWRSRHPGYVERNRLAKRSRDAKRRGMVAKGNEIESICIEKLDQISSLRLVAKGNERQQIIDWQIEGICKYLKGILLVAKRNDIDISSAFMRK